VRIDGLQAAEEFLSVFNFHMCPSSVF